MIHRILPIAGALTLLALAMPVHAQTAPILRLGDAINIDGDPADWPATVQRLPLEGPDGQATLRVGADKQNLYACFVVRDSSPLRNSAVRPEEMLKGGDAVALYLRGDEGTEERVMFTQSKTGPLVYLYRPVSEVKKPYVFASPTGTARFEYVAPFADAKVALKTIDGGYIAEAALPWRGLGFNGIPKGFDFDAQVIFSDPAGSTNAGAAWLFTTGGPALTVEDLPSEARLYPETWGQARIVDKVSGAVLSTKIPPSAIPPGLPIKVNLPRAGKLSLVIDDSKGWIIRELLKAEPRRAGVQNLEWDGRDRYGNVLPPGNYRWKALLFDGVGATFLGSLGSSGRPPYRTPDGLGAIGGQHGVPTALAADEGGVYMAGGGEEGQPSIRKINAQTGVALWKRSAGGFGSTPAIAAGEGLACLLNYTRTGGSPGLDFVRIDPATGQDTAMGQAKARVRLNFPTGTKFGGMAIAGKKAYFSLPAENSIQGINLETGAALPALTVSAPQGLCRASESSILVCSGDSVLKVNTANGTSTPVLRGLTEPRAVALDGEGNLYVSELGDSQQIKKFNATGKMVASWGTAGGKPTRQPVYNPLAFRNITVLALGPDQNLWLCESVAMPKRFIKMTREGKWLEDFYGPVAYNTFGPDLDDLSTVYYLPGGNNASAGMVQTKVDYAKYAANASDPAAWQVVAIHDLSLGADGQTVNELMKSVAETGYGHVFAFTGTNGKRYLFRPSKQNRAPQAPGAGIWVWEKGTWVPAAFVATGTKDTKFSWADKNGDGLTQDDEFYSLPANTNYSWIRRDLTLDGFAGTLAPTGTDARGVPTYDGAPIKPYSKEPLPDVEGGWTFFSNVTNGAVYFTVNVGGGRAMSFWDRADENRIIKVADGQEQWVIGEHSPRPNGTQLSTVSTISGEVDGMLLAGTVEPGNYVALTPDGFTLGNVLVDQYGQRPSVGPNVINIESFTGLLTKDPKTGKRVLFTVSSGDDRILEITGPGQTTRMEGDIKLDSSRPQVIETGNTTTIPYQSWYGNALRGMAVDGQDTEWVPESRGIALQNGNVTVADVRFRRDGGALCLFADVDDPTPLQTGEGLELKLAAPGGGPAYTVFVTAQPGKSEPWKGTVQITKDGVPVKTDAAKAAATSRWRGYGYQLEAEIPLSLMPELSEMREQTFRRAAKDGRTGKMSAVGPKKDTLPDLKSGVQLSATVIRGNERASWSGVEVAPKD